MAALKSLIIALLILFALVFLAMGLDVPIPHLPWRGLAARDVPIGILLVFAGLAVARFWTIPPNENQLIEDWHHRHKPRR